MHALGRISTLITLVALVYGCNKDQTTTQPPEAADATDRAGDADATPSSAPPAPADAPDILTVASFEGAVNDHMQDILDCYGEAAAKNDKLAGKLVADFKIDGKGSVVAVVAAGGSTLTDEGLLNCIKDKAQSWGLAAPPNGDATNMTFPFDFSPA